MQLDLFPTDIHLRCVDPTSNKQRFYAISVQRTLFGDWRERPRASSTGC
ncbi:MAG: hypothetical protein ROR55_06385 [Devosia sp.]